MARTPARKGPSVRNVIENARREIAVERDALALEIIFELSKRPPLGTPVKTGWARANWTPSLGAPDFSSGTPPHGGRRANVAMAAARQQAAIATLLATGPRSPDLKVHVYNPVPYVNRLNSPRAEAEDAGIEIGHSRQSAPGWVERSVDRALETRSVRSAARRAKL